MSAPAREDALSTAFVRAHAGALPIVLSVPHGGTKRIPGAARTRGETVTDAHTIEIAEEVARLLANKLGGSPYVVIGELSRKDVDLNRAPGDDAYEADAAKAEYDAYHGALRRYVSQIRERFGKGILIDLHGQSTVPGTVFRGTRGGRCVSRLIGAHGVEALTGPDAIFGRLEAAGYDVTPPNRDSPASPRDEASFNGGHIVFAYGSQNDDGIDAIQIELGKDYRVEARRAQTAEDLAEAIARFSRRYLGP